MSIPNQSSKILATYKAFPRRSFLWKAAFGASLVAVPGVFWSSSTLAGPGSERAYANLLGRAVKPLRVDYRQVRSEIKAVEAYVKDLQNAPVHQQKMKKLAFYINAYNALVINAVLQHSLDKGRRRVLSVQGFFDKKLHRVRGKNLTLNALEEKFIRNAGDPRIHFVVNCASVDCPPLRSKLYTAESLDKDLDKQSKLYLNRPDEVKVDRAKKTIQLVQIFEWYRKDFGGEKGVRRFVSKYRPDVKELLDTSYKIIYRPYDWNLNSI
ncbi:MAG: DUF547 domain-containing protein [Deltaproteobacteria bacterium]|nr:DUF547 domain-containing protein [Deltaproteobacteria bacterium]